MMAATALFALMAEAGAHALLERANPGAGTTLARAPAVVMLEYSEALGPAFSGIAVTDAGGRDVTAGPSLATGNRMQVPLKPLKQGSYRVTWHALSVDAHRTNGTYTFRVAP